MLTNLTVTNILLIEKLELDFNGGFTVITGESGAGKSIVMSCIKYLTGGKVTSLNLREGRTQGIVSGLFMITDVIKEALELLSIESSEEILVKRVIKANGSTRNYINDIPVSLSSLRSISGSLLEIHGQADQYKNFSPKFYMQMLDRFANTGELLKELKLIFGELTESERKLQRLEKEGQDMLKEKELTELAVTELEELDIKENEFASLQDRKIILSEKSKVEAIIGEALKELEQKGVSQYFFQLQKILINNVKLLDKYDGYSQVLKMNEEMIDQICNLQEKLEKTIGDSYSEESLEEITRRLFCIKDLCSKYKINPEEVSSFLEEKKKRLVEIESLAQDLGVLKQKIRYLEERYLAIALQLFQKREDAAYQLGEKMSLGLKFLALEKAKFKIEVSHNTERAKTDIGLDEVEFNIAINPGSKMQQIHRVASGGELSRLMLALKVAISGGDQKTFIFDEVDTGIGGAIADSVGVNLSKLAKNNQVISITHHAQVASKADQHILVKKKSLEKRANIDAFALSADLRLEEIARMLSGQKITQESRLAAKSLLEGNVGRALS